MRPPKPTCVLSVCRWPVCGKRTAPSMTDRSRNATSNGLNATGVEARAEGNRNASQPNDCADLESAARRHFGEGANPRSVWRQPPSWNFEIELDTQRTRLLGPRQIGCQQLRLRWMGRRKAVLLLHRPRARAKPLASKAYRSARGQAITAQYLILSCRRFGAVVRVAALRPAGHRCNRTCRRRLTEAGRCSGATGVGRERRRPRSRRR